MLATDHDQVHVRIGELLERQTERGERIRIGNEAPAIVLATIIRSLRHSEDCFARGCQNLRHRGKVARDRVASRVQMSWDSYVFVCNTMAVVSDERFDPDLLDDEDPFEIDAQATHLFKHPRLGIDDINDVWTSEPLFYPASRRPIG